MQLNPSEISELIKSKIENLSLGAETRTQGTVVSVTDGICRVHGLEDVMQACDTPKSTTDIVPVLFKRKLDLHQMTFAMGEAIAHLNHLEYQGRLDRIENGTHIRYIERRPS